MIERKPGSTRPLFLALALVLVLLLALRAVTPPVPLGLDAPLSAFSARRAMRDVAAVGAVPHPTGSREDARVLLWLAHRLALVGVASGLQRVPLDADVRARLARRGAGLAPGVAGANLLAVLPGRDRRAPALLLMAHHDSVAGSPGAADDGIGVASLVEIARALGRGPQPARDVLFLFTDAEEQGLVGARSFFAEPRLRGRVGIVVNLEARGSGGRATMFETGEGNGAMMRAFAAAVPAPSANALAVSIYRMMPNGTDLTEALAHDLPGFNIAITGRAALYHSPLSTPARLDPRSLQDMGAQALALTRALAFAPVLPARTPDAAFGDLWGSRLLIYPAWGGWLLLAASALTIGLAMLRVRPALRDLLGGMATVAALLAGTGLLLWLLNAISGAPGEYYDRLAALPRLELQAALACIAALLVASARGSLWGGWIALALVWGLFGVAAQLLLPGAGPFLHWPLLAAAAQMATAAWLDPRLERASALAPVALLGSGAAAQTLALGHLAFLNVGAGLPFAALPVLLGVALSLWPLLHKAIGRRVGQGAATAMLLAALALALWVRFDAQAPSVPTWVRDA